jgi:RNA polymerase sigma factor (sigma-70 family)
MAMARNLTKLTESQKELARSNIGLAWHVARRMRRRYGRSIDDFLGPCHEGLVYAARTFRPELGKFSTHACRWMSYFCAKELGVLVGWCHLPMQRGRLLPEQQRCADLVLSMKRSDGDLYGDNDEWHPVDPHPGPEAQAMAAESLSLLLILGARPLRVVEYTLLEGHTLREAGMAFGLSCEGVRRILKSALDQLRHSA